MATNAKRKSARREWGWNDFLRLLLGTGLIYSTPLSAADVPARFLGSQSCAASLCHGGAEDKRNEFTFWASKDYHTRAPATLSMSRSARIAETLNMVDATTDRRCADCHNPLQTVPIARKDSRVGKLEGVSCGSCHNAAENWLLTHTRTDLKYEQKVAAGMRDLKNLYVRANTCVACHQNIEPALRAAGHPELVFELDGQCATMPRHWPETNRLRGAQAWFIGQAVALREAAAQMRGNAITDDLKHRADALAWVLGTKLDADAADQLAQATANSSWTADRLKAHLARLTDPEAFARGDASNEALAFRAERVVIGLERLLIGLGLDAKSPASIKLDVLFRDIQSRPDFDAKVFADHLKEFKAALP